MLHFIDALLVEVMFIISGMPLYVSPAAYASNEIFNNIADLILKSSSVNYIKQNTGDVLVFQPVLAL